MGAQVEAKAEKIDPTRPKLEPSSRSPGHSMKPPLTVSTLDCMIPRAPRSTEVVRTTQIVSPENINKGCRRGIRLVAGESANERHQPTSGRTVRPPTMYITSMRPAIPPFILKRLGRTRDGLSAVAEASDRAFCVRQRTAPRGFRQNRVGYE